MAENRRFLKDFEENTTAAGAVFFFFVTSLLESNSLKRSPSLAFSKVADEKCKCH